MNQRDLSLSMLKEIYAGKEFSHILIRQVLDKYYYLEGSEKAFIKRLTEGTLERTIELDYVINQFSNTPVNKMKPLIRFLFPDIPKDDIANEYIATNMMANILGLGWAATPSGLLAMKELNRLNGDKETASNEMCTFLVINISSLQLIPINVIAYRMQYGSANPTEIIAPAIVATLVSTFVAIIFCLIMRKRGMEK